MHKNLGFEGKSQPSGQNISDPDRDLAGTDFEVDRGALFTGVGARRRRTAAGRGARRRDTPLSIIGFRMGEVVAGGGGALAGRWRGDRRRKSSARGGLEGWPGRRRTSGGECFRGGRGGAPPAAGGGGLLFGRLRGWRLKMNHRPLISYPTAAKSTDQR